MNTSDDPLSQINERGEARRQVCEHNLARGVIGMPSSAVRTFTDPDDYAASRRGSEAELTVTGPGRFAAKLIRIDLHRLWMQRFSDNLPRIVHSGNLAGRASIAFCTQPGPGMRANGLEMRETNIIRRSHVQDYFQESTGTTCWGSMSLPVEEMAIAGATMVGCILTPHNDALTITPPPVAMARLQHLHASAGVLAEHAPAVIAHPEAARGLEQALIEALVVCLGTGVGEDRSALRQHATIMRRFRRVVEENPDQALYIPEICKVIGASERTLRVCSQELLGVSPKRYLMLRRMHLVRRALRESGPVATTVTEIATRYGFWQFGRFAGEYRSLFGELPSATLAGPRD
jgi:AraC-like DNA-binding protein